eukprot:TRINITY_DN9243_c0_g1_i1.p1 TRINITY_DN9243_c0_g1~~TRINITY_DN9243_c0_g1_i1.p1  ORF type:complete len:292 (+),score=91.74 TRINITY_DN9243_c0_g1_i1:407-1282(+)
MSASGEGGAAFQQTAPAATVGTKRTLEQAQVPEGSWTCEVCRNVNYPVRTVCNIRTCQAPRPGTVASTEALAKRPKPTPTGPDPHANWICPVCGNSNLPGRVVCNMRKCQAPRPPVDWLCVCGNLNYKHRTVCNSRKCGRPNPAAVSQAAMFRPPQAPASLGVPVPTGQFMPPQHAAMAPAISTGPSPSTELLAQQQQQILQQKQALQYQEQQLQQQLQLIQYQQEQLLAAAGGAVPVSTPIAAAPVHPPNSWVCPTCQNVNYAHRTACNKRTCGAPRPQDTYTQPPYLAT